MTKSIEDKTDIEGRVHKNIWSTISSKNDHHSPFVDDNSLLLIAAPEDVHNITPTNEIR